MRLAADPQYRRLPGGGFVVSGFVSYWLAADHLLIVETLGFSERYRRLNFADIQALLIRPTRFRLIANLVLGALTLGVAGFLALLQSGTPISSSSILITGSLLGLPLVTGWVWANIHGPGCQVAVKTTVQQLNLALPRGRRTGEKFREQLAAAVSATQANAIAVPAPADTPPADSNPAAP